MSKRISDIDGGGAQALSARAAGRRKSRNRMVAVFIFPPLRHCYFPWRHANGDRRGVAGRKSWRSVCGHQLSGLPRSSAGKFIVALQVIQRQTVKITQCRLKFYVVSARKIPFGAEG